MSYNLTTIAWKSTSLTTPFCKSGGYLNQSKTATTTMISSTTTTCLREMIQAMRIASLVDESGRFDHARVVHLFEENVLTAIDTDHSLPSDVDHHHHERKPRMSWMPLG